MDQHAQADLDVDIRVDVEPTMDAIVEPALEAQPAHEAEVAAQAREPVDVERALEDAHAELAPTVERVAHDPRQVELHLEDGVELDDIELEQQNVELEQQNDAAQTPAPAAAGEPERAISEAVQLEPVQPELEQPGVEQPGVEQLALLEVEPDIADEVGAQPLRAPEPDLSAEQAREDAADAERARQEQARVTLAEVRRQAEAADAQREAREAAAAASAALEQTMQDLRAAMAALAADTAQRAQDEDAERQEQLTRWHEQDRADELDHGLDDGPSLGMG